MTTNVTPDGLRKAQALLERATTLDPGYADAWAALGLVHFQALIFAFDQDLARLDRAETHARRALEVDPANAWAHVVLGEVASWRGDIAESVRLTERAAELAPSGAFIRVWLGSARALEGKFLAALQEIQLGMRLHPRAAAGRAIRALSH